MVKLEAVRYPTEPFVEDLYLGIDTSK